MTHKLSISAVALSQVTPIRVVGGKRTGGYAAHSHEFMEMVLITSGRGVHRSANGHQNLSAGDLLVFRPGAWHAYSDCEALQMWDCSFLPALLDHELIWLMQHPVCAQLLWRGPLRDPAGFFHHRLDAGNLAGCIDPLSRLRAMSASDGNRLARIGVFLEFIDAVATGIHLPALARGSSLLVQRVMDLLTVSPAHGWTTRGLAHRVGVTASYLSRAMHAATGLPPMAYLARLRAERAANAPGRQRYTHRHHRRIGGMAGSGQLRAPIQGAFRHDRHLVSPAVPHPACSPRGMSVPISDRPNGMPPITSGAAGRLRRSFRPDRYVRCRYRWRRHCHPG